MIPGENYPGDGELNFKPFSTEERLLKYIEVNLMLALTIGLAVSLKLQH